MLVAPHNIACRKSPSWDALSRLSGVDKMPACEPATTPAASILRA